MASSVESAVFVWPVHLVGALYADLVEGQQNPRGFTFEHTAQGEHGERGDKLTIKFDCRSSLLNGRRIRLTVSGERAVGNFDAERTAALAMMEALRRKYSIFSADYSYGVITEKRALFTLMAETLKGCINTYYDLDQAVGGMHDSLAQLSTYVSTWLASEHPTVHASTMEAIGTISVWLKSRAASLDKDRKDTTSLVSALAAKEEYPASLVRLDQTASMPMRLDWEASYYLLRTEFDAAMSKIQATVSPIAINQLDGGTYTATITLSKEPYQFTSDPAQNQQAAKAKLMFNVLKYVDTVLGYGIIDLNHVLKEHMVSHVNQFNHRMELLWRCGQRMSNIGSTLNGQLSMMTTDVPPSPSPTPQSDQITIRINECAAVVAQLAHNLELTMSELTRQKVDKDALEATLTAPP